MFSERAADGVDGGVHLMLGLLQVPTGPQRKPQSMADLSFFLTPSQLLSEPQACQGGSKRQQRVRIIQSRQTLRYLSE